MDLTKQIANIRQRITEVEARQSRVEPNTRLLGFPIQTTQGTT